MKERWVVFPGLLGLCILVWAFTNPGEGQDEKARRARVLGLSCASCHGTDGKSAGTMPSIFGKSAEYIELKLKAFKSGQETSTVMGRLAKGYTDEEIRMIAEYYASLQQKK